MKRNAACNFFLIFAATLGTALVDAHLFAQTILSVGTRKEPFPSWIQVKEAVEAHFRSLPGFQAKDLITKSDVAPVFRELEALGWRDVAQSKAAEDLVDDSEFLARELRSGPGRTFMRRVSSYTLIYDRLDRIARMPGGQALVHDLIRLPDGQRYAQLHPPRGVPPMTDFLPKGASGKAPHVPDLDRPTGRIYTLPELLTRLEESHRQALPPANAR